MKDLLINYAGNFSSPFWADYVVQGITRSVQLGNNIKLVETLTESAPGFYSYSVTGIKDITNFKATFRIEAAGQPTKAEGEYAACYGRFRLTMPTQTHLFYSTPLKSDQEIS